MLGAGAQVADGRPVGRAEELGRLVAVRAARGRLVGGEALGRHGGQVLHPVVARGFQVAVRRGARGAQRVPAVQADGHGRRLEAASALVVLAQHARAVHQRRHGHVRGQGVHHLLPPRAGFLNPLGVRDGAPAEGAERLRVGGEPGQEAVATQEVRAGQEFGLREQLVTNGAFRVVVRVACSGRCHWLVWLFNLEQTEGPRQHRYQREKVIAI